MDTCYLCREDDIHFVEDFSLCATCNAAESAAEARCFRFA